MLIHGTDGTCKTLCLDFDVAKGGLDAVLADVRAVTVWLYELGARWIQDYSPNGGRHVYIPLQDRLPFHLSREIAQALSVRLKTLDPTPHQNIRHGCIRVPGSVHKSGGYQELEMSPTMAMSIFNAPASDAVIQRMRKDLAPEILESRPTPEAEPKDLPATSSGISRPMTLIATQGLYDTARYSSPSEARQAVLVSAVSAGMALDEIQRRMSDGTWPGLAQFYTRYSAAARKPALHRDWISAVRYVGSVSKKKPVQKTNTSEPTTQGGRVPGGEKSTSDEHRFIRTWRSALRITESRYTSGKIGMARRMILRALGEAAHKNGSRVIEFGVRSISVASGLEPTTVAAHLRALRSEPDALISHTGEAIGVNADQYTLVIPEHIRSGAEALSWRSGKLHSMRPAFRELGMPAAFVYEALEHSPANAVELAGLTGIGRSTVHEALEILASWNLAEKP